MAVTPLQSDILRLLAASRRERGESYVAGGVALNMLLATPRRSRDIDLFHDTEEALSRTWASDRDLLTREGFVLDVLREVPAFVEARVSRGGERSVIQWTRDSAYRFFPLIADDRMGLVLHPFDLATNKVLAMAGRVEARDWVDVLNCDERLQPLGYLVWSACGKDPGYNPKSLLAAVSRTHYSQSELDILDFDGHRPDAGGLGQRWHTVLRVARDLVSALPPRQVGKCVGSRNGELCRCQLDELVKALQEGDVCFHEGCIGGAWPRFRTC
jgi:hypothetical protein